MQEHMTREANARRVQGADTETDAMQARSTITYNSSLQIGRPGAEKEMAGQSQERAMPPGYIVK
jgi:hypothetical protein